MRVHTTHTLRHTHTDCKFGTVSITWTKPASGTIVSSCISQQFWRIKRNEYHLICACTGMSSDLFAAAIARRCEQVALHVIGRRSPLDILLSLPPLSGVSPRANDEEHVDDNHSSQSQSSNLSTQLLGSSSALGRELAPFIASALAPRIASTPGTVMVHYQLKVRTYLVPLYHTNPMTC